MSDFYEYFDKEFDRNVIPNLMDFVRIPNQSPLFDPDWDKNGLQEKATKFIMDWIDKQGIKGIKTHMYKDEGYTPLIFSIIDATEKECSEKGTTLMYGHFDKQPPMTDTWLPELGGPYDPKIVNGRLYGRAGADDGYSAFTAIAAIKALQEKGLKHGRICLLIEGSEESGSLHLEYYVNKISKELGDIKLIVCLDSGIMDYNRMWLTTSLRGLLIANLKVEVLTEGVHSGSSTGIVPSSFRILRQLLDRVEDSSTGRVLLDEFRTKIPEIRYEQAKKTVEIVGDSIHKKFPFVEGAKPVGTDLLQLYLNAIWEPTLGITGCEGIPNVDSAGSVLRPYTTLCLSFRLSPTADADKAIEALKKTFLTNVPYGAKVTLTTEGKAGFCAPTSAKWLLEEMDVASKKYFKGNQSGSLGEGGSIPFMGMLNEKFPKADFLVLGVLGPGSNAHGPNEFLDIDYTKRLCCCLTHLLGEHVKH